MPASPMSSEASRERIIEATAALLAAGGEEAVSIRAVSAAAGVQAPAIYRIFGDKQGLLDAVTTHGLLTHIRLRSTVGASDDPVDDLRRGWDLHIRFGLEHPAMYSIIYGEPDPGSARPAAAASADALRRHMRRLAEAGRLRVTEDRAVALFYAAGTGTTLLLISTSEERRDLTLSDLARDAVIAAIVTDAPIADAAGPVQAAVALRAVLAETSALSSAEQDLMGEWLERIARSAT